MQQTLQATTSVGNYRWTVCAMLFLATTINYIDRQILSLIKPILDDELGWTNEQFGLVNSFFQGTYGFGLLFFGWFVDKYGAKIGYTVSIVGWSLAAMGHSFVSSIGGFMAARAFLGVTEGGNFPSALKATALWFPRRERAFATSIFNAGTNAGPILAPAIVPWIAYSYGWQTTFIVAGIAGFLWLFLWIPFYHSPEESKRVSKAELDFIRSDKDEIEGTHKVSWGRLLRYRQTWSFIIAKFLTDPVWWFFLIWLPDFFKKTRGLDIKQSWIHLVTIYAIVTVLSSLGGWITG
ncbi:MAG TPA: MFS transporter, partial [Chryseosolibacter sp.]